MDGRWFVGEGRGGSGWLGRVIYGVGMAAMGDVVEIRMVVEAFGVFL